jgi:ubiquinone/menaquinone biosynthesis C-methylase UbiE
MNEEAHWNTIAPTYNDQIFDVFQSDINKRLPFYFKKHANKAHHAIDFGCGNGKSFPYLAPIFGSLTAVDISQKLLNEAKKRPFTNVRFKRMDLTKKNIQLPPADFVFCCNVAMLPEIDKTHQMIRNVGRVLKSGGNAVFVLPSLDSVLYSSWQLMELYKMEGFKIEDIPNSEFDYFKASKREIIQGIIYIDGVPTKHFGRTELEVVFKNCELTITNIDKVEYNWDSELSSPPDWLKDPYPWDWLVECTKL